MGVTLQGERGKPSADPCLHVTVVLTRWVAGWGCVLYVCLQPIHVYGAVFLLLVLPPVVGVFPLLSWPDPLLQLDQSGHIRGRVVLPDPRRRGLVAAVLLVLVGHHLLDADHGLGLADQRHLVHTTA